MKIQTLLHTADEISTWVGKAFAWLIVVLMVVVVVEVFKRYALNAPTAWVFDVSNLLYGTLFMMGGAYTLCQDGHVRVAQPERPEPGKALGAAAVQNVRRRGSEKVGFLEGAV